MQYWVLGRPRKETNSAVIVFGGFTPGGTVQPFLWIAPVDDRIVQTGGS